MDPLALHSSHLALVFLSDKVFFISQITVIWLYKDGALSLANEHKLYY